MHNGVHFLKGKVAWYANRRVNKPKLLLHKALMLIRNATTFIDVAGMFSLCIERISFAGVLEFLIKIHVKFTLGTGVANVTVVNYHSLVVVMFMTLNGNIKLRVLWSVGITYLTLSRVDYVYFSNFKNQ